MIGVVAEPETAIVTVSVDTAKCSDGVDASSSAIMNSFSTLINIYIIFK